MCVCVCVAKPYVSGNFNFSRFPDLRSNWIFITILSTEESKPALLLDLALLNYLFKFDILFSLCMLFLMRHIHHIVFWRGLQARKIQAHHWQWIPGYNVRILQNAPNEPRAGQHHLCLTALSYKVKEREWVNSYLIVTAGIHWAPTVCRHWTQLMQDVSFLFLILLLSPASRKRNGSLQSKSQYLKRL